MKTQSVATRPGVLTRQLGSSQPELSWVSISWTRKAHMPRVLSDDPVNDFNRARAEMLAVAQGTDAARSSHGSAVVRGPENL